MVLPLRVHSLPGCDVTAEASRGSLELLALGDFAPTNDSAEVLPLDARGTALKFPAATQAASARLGNPTAFFGYGERREQGLDILLWPRGKSCQVWPPGRGSSYPGRAGGQAFAYSSQLGLALAAGGDDPLASDAIVGAVWFDAATGAVRTLDSTSEGALREPRAFASATPFGPGFLVAGGQRPVAGVDALELELNDTAEVFDAAAGRFVGEPIALLGSRTHHAAIALDDGRSLLVGGRSKVGSVSIAQYQLEIVDPTTRRSQVGDAITPRIDPRVVRLSDGRIFVGGGNGLDGAPTQPVAEWLSATGKLTSTRLALDVAPRFERAFVALAGGGVLAVGGCEDRPPASDDDLVACAAACTQGCPPLDGYDAWWIDADGAATLVALDGITAARPVLLPGSDGRPWLIAAAASEPSEPRLYRFDPWGRRFEAVFTSPDLRLPRPGRPQPQAFDGDAFAWLDEEAGRGAMFGLRLGNRSRYAQDVALVIAPDDDDPTRPAHLVPTRPIVDSLSYDGSLSLFATPSARPRVDVQVADTDYADVTVELTLLEGKPPLVLLGATTLGGDDCPWPDGLERGGDFDRPTLLRHDTRAELRFHGGKRQCEVAPGRLSLALGAGSARAVLGRLDITRGPPQR